MRGDIFSKTVLEAAFSSRPPGSERGSQSGIWEKNILDRGPKGRSCLRNSKEASVAGREGPERGVGRGRYVR